MDNRSTRREIAMQFIVTIESLLEWLEQKDDSKEKLSNSIKEEHTLEIRLLSAPEIARIQNTR
jgi:hypothetical protein